MGDQALITPGNEFVGAGPSAPAAGPTQGWQPATAKAAAAKQPSEDAGWETSSKTVRATFTSTRRHKRKRS
eukprot:9393034-Pyramimonas_sp.AAC.1